jgi:hypothetical protein
MNGPGVIPRPFLFWENPMTKAERAAALDMLTTAATAANRSISRVSRDSGVDLSNTASSVQALFKSAYVLVAGAVVSDPDPVPMPGTPEAE